MTKPPTWDGRIAEALAAATQGHLRRAAATLHELAGECSSEAEKADGLMSDVHTGQAVTRPQTFGAHPITGDLTSCQRGAHADGPVDQNGWVTCSVCGRVNTTPRVV